MSNVLKLDDYRLGREMEIEFTPEVQAIIDLYIARNGGAEDEAIEALLRLGMQANGELPK